MEHIEGAILGILGKFESDCAVKLKSIIEAMMTKPLTLRILSGIGLLSGSLFLWQPGLMEAIAQGSATQSSEPLTLVEQAQLSAAQVETLKAFEHPVAVPAFVPTGFAVSEVEVIPAGQAGFVPLGSSYRIVYQQAQATDSRFACFEVEGSLGGFGGPMPEYHGVASLPEFAEVPEDYTYQLFWSDGESDEGPFPIPVLFSDWIEDEEVFYRVSSWGAQANGCDRISPTTANQILESLQYLP